MCCSLFLLVVQILLYTFSVPLTLLLSTAAKLSLFCWSFIPSVFSKSPACFQYRLDLIALLSSLKWPWAYLYKQWFLQFTTTIYFAWWCPICVFHWKILILDHSLQSPTEVEWHLVFCSVCAFNIQKLMVSLSCDVTPKIVSFSNENLQ